MKALIVSTATVSTGGERVLFAQSGSGIKHANLDLAA